MYPLETLHGFIDQFSYQLLWKKGDFAKGIKLAYSITLYGSDEEKDTNY